jgi:hypothetical protein
MARKNTEEAMRWGLTIVVAGWLLAGAAQADAQVAYRCGGPHRVTYSDRPCAGARVVGAPAPHRADKWKAPPQDRAKIARRAPLPAAAKQECSALDARLQQQQAMLETLGSAATLHDEMPLVQSRQRYRELKC